MQKSDADHEQLVAIHSQELHRRKIGELEVGFACGSLIPACGKRRRGGNGQERYCRHKCLTKQAAPLPSGREKRSQ